MSKLFNKKPKSKEDNFWKDLPRVGIGSVVENQQTGAYSLAIGEKDSLSNHVGFGGIVHIPTPKPLSIDIQARAILFEGECLLNGMIADNNQRKACNESMAYTCIDFDNLQEEIQNRIKELK